MDIFRVKWIAFKSNSEFYFYEYPNWATLIKFWQSLSDKINGVTLNRLQLHLNLEAVFLLIILFYHNKLFRIDFIEKRSQFYKKILSIIKMLFVHGINPPNWPWDRNLFILIVWNWGYYAFIRRLMFKSGRKPWAEKHSNNCWEKNSNKNVHFFRRCTFRERSQH